MTAPELDGAPVSPAALSALALLNYGHFTTMRVTELRVPGLAAHLARLARDCRVLFDHDLDVERVRRLVRRVVPDAAPTVVRVTVFAPALGLADPAAPVRPSVLVTTRSAAAAAAEGEVPPVRLGSVQYRRDLPAVKHVGLFGTVHHRRAARLAGFDDALFVDDRSRIIEGPSWNVGFLRGDRVVWPAADHLPGVTMGLVRELLDAAGFSSVTAPIALADLGEVRAGFVTNAVVGVRPVASVDGVEIQREQRFVADLAAAYGALRGQHL